MSFPWNFADEELPSFSSGFWNTFIKNRELLDDFNQLYREFHQACAIPDYVMLKKTCEPSFYKYMENSLHQIHFHGLDVEMANLTINQPKINIVDVSLTHGITLDKTQRGSKDDWSTSEGSLLGAKCTTYTHKSGKKGGLIDNMFQDYKPYNLSVTAQIHSPMKLFVWNQNRSKVIFGSDDSERVSNLIKFEMPMRLVDFGRFMPTRNKPRLIERIKITDFNNCISS